MIGFDIGGTKCAVCIGNRVGDRIEITDKRKIPTDLSRSPYEMLDTLCRMAEEMTNDFSRIGISCGGPLDAARGVILSPPNLPGWDEVRVTEYLHARYHGRVALENDANACALAEWKYGAGRGTENMIFLTFGTGMGAGLILNGQLYRGACGNAGEIGHVRMAPEGPIGYGKAGSFEGFVSGGGITRLAATFAEERLQTGAGTAYCCTREELPLITAERVATAAKAGDPTALAVYRTCGKKLGEGLSLLVDILNPEMIVIGSIYTRAGELLREGMERVLQKEALPASLRAVKILPAALGEHLGDYAALAVAVAAGETF